MKHTVEVMIPEAEIKARIAELGRQITEHYKDSGSEMVLVGLLPVIGLIRRSARHPGQSH